MQASPPKSVLWFLAVGVMLICEAMAFQQTVPESQRCQQEDQKLNQAYQELRVALTTPEKAELRKAQREWIASRDVQVSDAGDRERAFFEETKKRGGTLSQLVDALRSGSETMPSLPSHTSLTGIDEAGVIKMIRNGPCAVPNLDHGFHTVKLSWGRFASRNRDHEESVGIREDSVWTGIMDGKPMAVAVVGHSTGGSGVFTELMLYEVRGKRVAQVGDFTLGDRPEIRYVAIRNGKVLLFFKDPNDVPYTRFEVLGRGDFTKITR